MFGSMIALVGCSFSLVWLTIFGGRDNAADLYAALLLLGATALFYWGFRSGQTPPRMPVWQKLALWGALAYSAFQIVPLPLALVSSLSPTRAALTANLAKVVSIPPHIPLSIVPAVSLANVFWLLGCLTVFNLLRDLSWKFIDFSPWLSIAPIVGIAVVEALLSLIGTAVGISPLRYGTFSTSAELSALLQMAIPFALAFGFISFRRLDPSPSRLNHPLAGPAVAWGAVLLFLTVLFLEQSTFARLCAFGSIYLLMVLAVLPRLRTQKLQRYGTGIAVVLAILFVLLLVSAPPSFDSPHPVKAQNLPKTEIWKESVALWTDFRWFGTGPGGFPSAFTKYQSANGSVVIKNPSSDLLNLSTSFGVVGLLLLGVALLGFLRPAVIGAWFLNDESRRLLAAALVASLSTILFRGLVQATLSIPAVAMGFAWLGGVSQSSQFD